VLQASNQQATQTAGPLPPSLALTAEAAGAIAEVAEGAGGAARGDGFGVQTRGAVGGQSGAARRTGAGGSETGGVAPGKTQQNTNSRGG
jgi:hypothetical protein